MCRNTAFAFALLLLTVGVLSLPVLAQVATSPSLVTTIILTRGNPKECTTWMKAQGLPEGIDQVVEIDSLNDLLVRAHTRKAIDEINALAQRYQQQAGPAPTLGALQGPLQMPKAAEWPSAGTLVMVLPVKHLNARELQRMMSPADSKAVDTCTPINLAPFLPDGITNITAIADDYLLVTGKSPEVFQQMRNFIELIDKPRKVARVQVSLRTMTKAEMSMQIIPNKDEQTKPLATGYVDIANGNTGFIPLEQPGLPGILIRELLIFPDDSVAMTLQPLYLSESRGTKDGVTLGVTAPADKIEFRLAELRSSSTTIPASIQLAGEAKALRMTVRVLLVDVPISKAKTNDKIEQLLIPNPKP